MTIRYYSNTDDTSISKNISNNCLCVLQARKGSKKGSDLTKLVIDKKLVQQRVGKLLKKQDLSKFIL